VIRFLSLCAGIGGFDLGFERSGMRCVGQVEIDPYCRRVLSKHWPDVWQHDDVLTLSAEMVRENCGDVDLICAGFPCQDLSVAGKQAGLHDGKQSSIFFDIMRVVRMVRPRYVCLENVPALLSRPEWMGAVLGELAESGYDAWWDCVPAQAVGAPHVRDRVFIVADAQRLGRESWSRCEESTRIGRPKPAARGKDVADAGCERGRCGKARRQDAENARKSPGCSFARQWFTEPDVGRVAHGVPNRLDRLRGLGNAIVPQVAEYIGMMIVAQHQEAIA